jgi:hypothetical protein
MKNHKDSKKGMKEFLDLKAPTYKNKNNGQISIVLPKKELMKMMHCKKEDCNMNLPKFMPIRIFKWRNK